MEFEKREYQEECIDIINNITSGKYLVVMATGLGKTFIFSRIKRKGRMLILSHREELVYQPKKFFDCSFGIELNKSSSDGEEVVSASTLTLIANDRYLKFKPNEFDIIVVDEAHHAPAKTYRKLIDYFKPRLLLGFTATPNRGDGVRLDDIFTDIIYEKNIKWGIEHGFLSNVQCIRVRAGYDLSNVGTYMGDYKISELDKALRESDGAIVDAYYKYAKGATLIFTVSVEQAERLQKKIRNSVVVKASTQNREEIINQLRERKIDCVINCMVFTEGTDIPLCETIIIARPTKSSALYSQMVGRGLRVYPGKEKLLLIDIVGVSADNKLCSAPCLLGVDMHLLEKKQQDKIQGDLLSLPEKILRESDCPASWVKSAEYVELWANDNEYNLRDINWIQLPDGTLTLSIPKNERLNRPYSREFRLSAPDELGFTTIQGVKIKMQAALDMVYNILMNCYRDCENIWNSKLAMATWGKSKASEKQVAMIKRSKENLEGVDFNKLSRYEASLIINRIISSNHHSSQITTILAEEVRKKYQTVSAESKSHNNKDSNEKPYRSVVNYLKWRYPKVMNDHSIEILKKMYGRIPKYMVDDDEVYYSLIKTESERIQRYENTNAYSFDGAVDIIHEFSKLSFHLLTKHIQEHKTLKCSKALVYSVKKLRDDLTKEQKWKMQDEIETIIADLCCAGGNYSTISSRASRLKYFQ